MTESENPVIQIKDALTALLKKLDPDTDVFYEEIKDTDPDHGFGTEKTWYFIDLVPSANQTVDGIYTDRTVLLEVSYHEKGESNTSYLIKAAQIDAAVRPVFRFGNRAITVPDMDITVTDHVLHCVFRVSFRHSEEQPVTNEVMQDLGVDFKKESE